MRWNVRGGQRRRAILKWQLRHGRWICVVAERMLARRRCDTAQRPHSSDAVEAWLEPVVVVGWRRGRFDDVGFWLAPARSGVEWNTDKRFCLGGVGSRWQGGGRVLCLKTRAATAHTWGSSARQTRDGRQRNGVLVSGLGVGRREGGLSCLCALFQAAWASLAWPHSRASFSARRC